MYECPVCGLFMNWRFDGENVIWTCAECGSWMAVDGDGAFVRYEDKDNVSIKFGEHRLAP